MTFTCLIERIRVVALTVLAAGAALLSTAVSGSAAEPPFPVTVTHVFGSTVIPAEPKRIVTIGWSSEDAVLALGKVPIAMPRYSFFNSGIFPWNEALLGERKPVLLPGRIIDFEKIAELRPDLILATNSDIDGNAWKRLSAIAPTVAYRHGAYQTDWREQAQLVGAALGKSAEAAKLVSDVDLRLTAAGEKYPVLAGKTFVFGTYFPGASNVVVYLPSDPRVKALIALGMKPAPGVEMLASRTGGQMSTSVSLEEIGLLDSDVLLMWFGDGARAAAESNSLFRTLRPVREGGYLVLEDPVDVWSTSALSVLSIPYGFSRFIPKLADAASRSAPR